MRRWILVVFGKNVSRKVGNGQMHNFPPRLTGVFALVCKTGTTENVLFLFNVVRYFANKHAEHFKVLTYMFILLDFTGMSVACALCR